MKKSLLLILFVACAIFVRAQNEPVLLTDSTFLIDNEEVEMFEEVSELDPIRAALLSAMLPGLGQAYNKQYWKVPLAVSGIVVFGHFIDYNNKLYHSLRNAAKLQAISDNLNPYNGIINSQDALIRNRDNFRRNRDYLMILGSAFYLFQIVDAHVSAHLDEFNVNDELVLKIEPSIQSTPLFSQAVGVSFIIRF